MEKGKRKWVRIIYICIYMYTWVATCLNETKKGGEIGKKGDRQHA